MTSIYKVIERSLPNSDVNDLAVHTFFSLFHVETAFLWKKSLIFIQWTKFLTIEI